MDTLLEAGDFEASTNTRSEATAEVVRLMVDEFWRLQRERVGERELADAKAYLTGSFPLTIETPDAIATQVLNVLFYGLPVEQLQSFRERVNAVRPDDIERVSRYYLRPDRLSIVLVGNAAAFTRQLRSVGFDTFEVVNMDQLDLLTADFKEPAAAPAAAAGGGAASPRGTARPQYSSPASQSTASAASQSAKAPAITPQEGAAARALLDKVIAAKGGLDRLRGIRTLVVSTRERSFGPNQEVNTVNVTTDLEYPDHVRVEMTTPQGPVIRGYDGSTAWAKDPRGIQDIPRPMIDELRASLRRDIIAALVASADGRLRVRLLPDVKDDSGALHHALEFSATDLDPMVLYVDPATNLVTKQTYVSGGLGRSLVEEIFSDYRSVDGVQIAHAARVRVGGRPMLERHVTAITINAPIAPSAFKRPAS
jgi:hypothetical protein